MNARKDDLDDVLKLVSFFKDMKAINDEFFYDIQVDKDKSIKNIFWSNASCRGAYQDFGDCITFDTTYKTNRFHMPLGVFVGTNHHLQSMIFAVVPYKRRRCKVIQVSVRYICTMHEQQTSNLHSNR